MAFNLKNNDHDTLAIAGLDFSDCSLDVGAAIKETVSAMFWEGGRESLGKVGTLTCFAMQ